MAEMDCQQPRIIKRDVYQAFDKLHRAICDVLIEKGQVKISEW